MSYLHMHFSRNIQKMNSFSNNSKLNINEPLKAIKLLISSFVRALIDIDHSSWLLVDLPAIALKAAAERDMHLIFSQLFTFSDTLQVL